MSTFKILVTFIVTFISCASAQAGWEIFDDNTLFNRGIETDTGSASVGVSCSDDGPILLVEWTANYTVIRASVDGIELEIERQLAADTGVQVIFLKPVQINKFINGTYLELVAIPLLSDKSYATASLIGFTKAYKQTGCVIAPTEPVGSTPDVQTPDGISTDIIQEEDRTSVLSKSEKKENCRTIRRNAKGIMKVRQLKVPKKTFVDKLTYGNVESKQIINLIVDHAYQLDLLDNEEDIEKFELAFSEHWWNKCLKDNQIEP